MVFMADSDVYVVWDDAVTGYNFGPSHPMHPLRLDLTAKLAMDFGLFDADNVHIHGVSDVEEDTLANLHDADFIAAVKKIGDGAELSDEDARKYGIGTEDVPGFENMHAASAMLFQGSVDSARAIISGDYSHAVNFTGGMHHAMPDHASGFCVYNDIAGAITEFLGAGYERIAYIDLDAHHGDGVEKFFWDDPRVLTISMHESGKFLFPGSGFPADIGGLRAAASAANIALPPRTLDADWLRAFDATIPAIIDGFQPQVIVSQHGCDGHRSDPLTHMRLSVDAMRVATEWVRDLAAEHTGGKWLATGGGGYAIIDVVPRAWTNVLAISAGLDIDPGARIPGRWANYAQTKTGREAPLSMTDGYDGEYTRWSNGFDPESELDRAVMGTRKNLFPFFGLDPYFD
ncbi:acetoin utilization protein AcuC [Brevibacterium zhoupengii]|uniref:acetoin utilization protein AcuC n=1 Tax=Brevibacterium zhoupengii TaxID=2898795 RepID=UPI001E3014F5|nr:acetoin utilization protein AcuC [Brevibacterium zhoupengii]